ncbi:MAG: hypothetical protein EKK55_02170 [Rhodocyclaceae bacterium]|nr:MAG: hypothetical protein EKK55_02170 [Rhodocyclaceae bacterium]
MSDLDFVKKANIQVSTISPEGILQPERAQEFVELVIQESQLMQLFDVRLLDRPEWEQPRIGFNGQVVFPDNEFESTPEGDLAEPDVDKRALSVKRVKAVARISFRTLKTVINKGNFIPYLMPLLAKAARRDIEKLVLRGDTTLPATTAENRLLRLTDGIIKLASANTYDAGGDPLNATVLDALDMAIPDQYQDSDEYVVLTSRKAGVLYRGERSKRATPGGDDQLDKKELARHHGTPIIGAGLIPSDLGSPAKHSVALRLQPKNVLVGFQDDMEVMTETHADPGYYLVVMRYSLDTTFMEPQAVAKATNVYASAT